MKYYSNEIVFRGHPDKVCDQISAAILDACVEQDKNSRCGIETVGGKGKIFITGEITTNAKIDVEAIARESYEILVTMIITKLLTTLAYKAMIFGKVLKRAVQEITV